MTIVMGLDQHRAQITAEWIDTEHGRDRAVAGSAGAPGARPPVPSAVRWPAAGGGAGGDDGWRFVVEELRAVGARVHLAEPAETSALRGNKKRPKTDRADARHLRELLMIGGCRSAGSRPIASARSARSGAAAAHADR